MLRKESISPELAEVLDAIMQIKSLRNHRLVGGTALALQIGHRKSIDIDLFSENNNSYDSILEDLKTHFGSAIKAFRFDKRGLSANILGVKVDVYDWDSRFIKAEVVENGWRLAHKEDIIPMKLNVFFSYQPRYEKKDYVDIACLLKEYDLEKMVALYFVKFPENLLNDRIIVEKCGKYDNAEDTTMPEMLNGQTWDETKNIINKGIDDFMKTKGIITKA